MRRHALWTLIAIVAAELGLVGAGGAYYVLSQTGGVHGPPVVASFYPYQFLASRVAGDRFAVSALVPPGVEPHDWEPTPQDVLTIGDAAAFVYNGYVEAYLPNLLNDLPPDRPLRIDASAGLSVIVGGEGGANAVDPHLWLDPVRVESSVDTIATGLSQVDPSAAAVFQANAAKLRQDLARIDGLFAAGLQTCARRVFITQHASFAYLAARYNLTQSAIQGLSPDQEPTPVKIQEILNLIDATGSNVIFFEELVNPAVAQTLADEAHVRTMVLSPIEGLTAEERANGDTYLSLMERNLQNLRTALECA
jgi:zinc transport system substrate-binding protein